MYMDSGNLISVKRHTSFGLVFFFFFKKCHYEILESLRTMTHNFFFKLEYDTDGIFFLIKILPIISRKMILSIIALMHG